jgi:rare lipoprotein A
MRVSRLGMPVLAARWAWLGTAAAGAAFGLSGCANQTVQHYAHGHEYFPQSKYGHASPKVVADGQPVPKGGGQYLVGHPYRVAGHTYVPAEVTSYTAVGMASWYGAAFHGRRTANGEVYDMASLSAAHPTMPLPSYARVTNIGNGYSVIVRVNDRGPFHGGRVMDVSSRTADVLGFKGDGSAKIKVEYVGPAPLEGSDDRMLLASLRTDGSPASLDGYAAPVMVASAFDPGTSLFGALFSGGRGGPQPAPQATPQPEPIRIAAAAPPPVPPEPIQAAPEPVREEPRAAVAIRQPRGPIPVPPARPFDLGAAHRPTLVAVASRSKPAPPGILPPRRPLMQASAEKALYFADPALDGPERLGSKALDRVRPLSGSTVDE